MVQFLFVVRMQVTPPGRDKYCLYCLYTACQRQKSVLFEFYHCLDINIWKINHLSLLTSTSWYHKIYFNKLQKTEALSFNISGWTWVWGMGIIVFTLKTSPASSILNRLFIRTAQFGTVHATLVDDESQLSSRCLGPDMSYVKNAIIHQTNTRNYDQ